MSSVPNSQCVDEVWNWCSGENFPGDVRPPNLCPIAPSEF